MENQIHPIFVVICWEKDTIRLVKILIVQEIDVGVKCPGFIITQDFDIAAIAQAVRPP